MRAFSFVGKLRLTIQRQIVQVNVALTSYDVFPMIVRQELSELRAIALLVFRDTAQFSPPRTSGKISFLQRLTKMGPRTASPQWVDHGFWLAAPGHRRLNKRGCPRHIRGLV